MRTASAAGRRAKQIGEPPAAGQKCRVWTASYGGQKAIIIRSLVDKVVNYTVLDVNDGAEKREADAFIAAYAKDGTIAGEFASQNAGARQGLRALPGELRLVRWASSSPDSRQVRERISAITVSTQATGASGAWRRAR